MKKTHPEDGSFFVEVSRATVAAGEGMAVAVLNR
jgi:hypothetical protein